MTSEAARAAIAKDIDDAVSLGVTYTPMVFVNGHEWKWYQSRGTLVDLVDRVARQALQTVTPPNAVERLTADWRAAPLIRSITGGDPQPLPVPRFSGDLLPAENEARDDRPDVIIALDYTLDGTSLALRELAALAEEGVAFRLFVWQFPANAECNPLPGLPRNATPSCLASLLVTATAMTAGTDAASVVHEWLRTNRENIALEAILPILATLPGGSQPILAAFTDGRALERTRQEAAALSSRMQVRSLPTIIVDRRPIPRWEHPGAAPRELFRTIIAEAAATRLRQRGEIAQPDGLGR
jgi:predicted DsbA family dithiol-disulfide isomerase